MDAGIPFVNDKIKINTNIKKIKLDIGIAIEAIHTEDWLNKDKNDLLVFGFEPLPYCIDETKKYFSQPISKWKSTNIIDTNWLNNNFLIVPVALGKSTSENVPFYVTTNNIGCSSILAPSFPTQVGINLEKIIHVSMFKLSDFFELLPLDDIEYIEYIKVDVQGTDLEVIKSGGKYISEKVVYVTMEPETTTYVNAENNSINEMIKYMESIGFTYITHPNTHDPTFLNKRFENIANTIYISQFN